MPTDTDRDAAADIVRCHADSIRKLVATFTATCHCRADETVTFLGPRVELARFFPSEILTVTEPVVATVLRTQLAQIFHDAGYSRFVELYAALIQGPAMDGGLRILVAGPRGLSLTRLYRGGIA